MQSAPLDRLRSILPRAVLGIVDRDTPIPSIALRAAKVRLTHPELVRADIGQISELDPGLEVYYGPPVGLEDLRRVIAETWNRTLSWAERFDHLLPGGFGPEHVAICTGAAEGLTLLFRCFADDKNVGLPRGHWENYTNGVELAGGRPVLIDYFDARGRFDPEGLKRQIKDLKLELIVANFPCNPTGAVLNEEENQSLGKVLEETGCLAIADEVYWRLRYDGHPPTSLLTAAPGHVVSVSSGSKEYLLPGARVGYVISTRSEVTDKALRKLIRANTASPNVPGQRRLLEYMALDLEDLRNGQEAGLLLRVRLEMKHRRDLLLEVLGRHGFSTVGRIDHQPEGTIFLMAGLPAWWRGSDVDFSETALEEACVSVVPGTAFALENCVRFSYGGLTGTQIAQLDDNLHRFRQRHMG